MSNDALKLTGPGFIADLARMGGDVFGEMTDAMLAASGPSSIGDRVRSGVILVSPVISGTPVLTATELEAYDGFTVSATGGTLPYVFALVGTWPDGIVIDDATGEVSGTPAEGEDGSFAGLSVSVTDADEEVDTLATFTLVVEAAG
jgi:hypothetical protein